jgi:primase-polymerase (primpol)-like protein
MNDLKKEKRWVLWLMEEVNGRKTKVPYTIRGKKASSTNPKDWSTYAECKSAIKLNGFGSGIGVIFTPEKTLLGIDIDHVLLDSKTIAPERAEEIEKLIKKAKTFTEISPSGTGLHLYFRLSEGLELSANRHAPYEAYTAGRFFTFTEDSFRKQASLRTVSSQEALEILAIIGYPWKEKEVAEEKKGLIQTSNLTDEKLLEKMFNSKKGSAIKKLYGADASEYDNDFSRADAALLNHLAFWSGKDSEQMDRLWLQSPLGSRSKTTKRKDYRTRSITNAIANCKEVYKNIRTEEFEIDFLYTVSAKGDKIYSKNTENVCRVFRHHPDFEGRYRLDEFKNRIEVKEGDVWRPLTDTDAIGAQTQVSILYQFMRTVSKDMCFDAIVKVSKENAIDSAKDFLKRLEWDKKYRLDSWLTETYGTADDEYHRKVGSNWMKGLVKRIMVPGSKFDYVLVLEGAQGVKKSTSLNVIGYMSESENWHVESTMSADNKDFFMQFEGKAIIEFSEGETLSRTEVKKMKSIITTASDRYRPSYGRTAQDFPRRCVFAMTTNLEEYLKDETGNRRWLPVKVELDQVNIEWLRENRDQLLAEAYERVMNRNETTYEFPLTETQAAQNARRVSDPNEEKIAEWYYGEFSSNINKEDGITCQMVFNFALSGMGSMKKYEEMMIADVLQRVLKLEKRRKYVNGIQSMRWFEKGIPIQSLKAAYVNNSEFEDDELPFND